MTLPSDVILLLRQVANSGFAPLDLMAEDMLKRYVPQVGPSEHKVKTETFGGVLRYAEGDDWSMVDS